MKDKVILVDSEDNPVGIEDKYNVHVEGKLHRAFSVFLFNSDNQMLLQKRALDKYHCGGMWTNACCSHPAPNENLKDAAQRRLIEEMGIICDIQKAFDFIYKAHFSNGLIEYEFDHVFMGKFDGFAKPNPDEVMAYKWISIAKLKEELEDDSERFTPWFKIAIPRVFDTISIPAE